jgi:integrase
MPRSPKRAKTTFEVLVNDVPVRVILHPPTAIRTSWYAYWKGLVASKSTGRSDLDEAKREVARMLQNNGKRPTADDKLLTDEEFEAIQRTHFHKRGVNQRTNGSLRNTLEAIRAFRDITGLKPVTKATAGDCERFQLEAQQKPNNWRRKWQKADSSETLRLRTIVKWSRELRAAWERANVNAGTKCVRTIVNPDKSLTTINPEKLLTDNPWHQFTWIDTGEIGPIRHLDPEELLTSLDFLETRWAGVTVAALILKVAVWSGCRKQELTSLSWLSRKKVGDERHFQVTGKHGVEKWFRVPTQLYEELKAIRTASPFVFAAYNDQLRAYWLTQGRPREAANVNDAFVPASLGVWMHQRMIELSEVLPKGEARLHEFRRTVMKFARRGEDLNRQVAGDLRVGESVMTGHYFSEEDEEHWQRSNRVFRRIVQYLPQAVAERYGHVETERDRLRQRVQSATAAGDWALVAQLSAELAKEP